MAFGGGNSNSAFLAVLIVAAALVSQTAGISLKARDHRFANGVGSVQTESFFIFSVH